MRDDAVDLILEVLVFCKDFPLFHLLYDAIDKLKTFSVRSLYRCLIFQVDI